MVQDHDGIASKKRKYDGYGSELERRTAQAGELNSTASPCDGVQLEGIVKSYNNSNGFGFIAANHAYIVDKDIWFCRQQYLGNAGKLAKCLARGIEIQVKFVLKYPAHGKPRAEAVECLSDECMAECGDSDNFDLPFEGVQFEGVVKSFSTFNGFGFILADHEDIRDKDIWFSRQHYLGRVEKLETSVGTGIKVRVKFILRYADDGKPQAQAVESFSDDTNVGDKDDEEQHEEATLHHGVVERFEFHQTFGKSYGFIRCDDLAASVYFTARSLSDEADPARFRQELKSERPIRVVFRLRRSPDVRQQAESVKFLWEEQLIQKMPRNFNIGDWICPGCGDHQFSRNTKCRKCKTARPADAIDKSRRPGDWTCPSCTEVNFSRNQVCRECATPNPDLEGSIAAVKKFHRECMKPGDWVCPCCDVVQFARFPECPVCATPNPDPDGSIAAMMEGKAKKFVGKMLPGDWQCLECGDHQFANNTKCRQCGALKPLSVPGDWHCPSCGKTQFAYNTSCMECGTANPDPAGSAAARKEYRASLMKPGDWLCPSCAELQFAMSDECNKCGTRNPDPEGCKAAMKAAKAKQFEETKRAGDWLCPQCGDHVFARSKQCRRCHIPNPDENAWGSHGYWPDRHHSQSREAYQSNDHSWRQNQGWEARPPSTHSSQDRGWKECWNNGHAWEKWKQESWQEDNSQYAAQKSTFGPRPPLQPPPGSW